MCIVVAAWLAAFLVFSSFFMKTIVPLRIIAVVSNAAFIVYALLGYVLARLVAIMFMRNVMVSQSSRSRGYRPRVE